MNSISLNQFSTSRWSLFEDVLQYSQGGYSSIGLWRSKVEDFGQAETTDLLHEMKLSVSSVHWAGGFTGSDGRSFDLSIDDAKNAIRFASAVNANCLIVHPGSRNMHTYGHLTRLLRTALDALVPFATDFDVCLAIEPMASGGFREWTFIEDFAKSMELVRAYPAESVGLVLDLFHFGNSQSVADELPNLNDRIKLVQVADKRQELLYEDNRCPLGIGQIPIANWLRSLIHCGYDGPFEIELHGFDMECVEYRDMLRNSHEFIRSCLRNIESTGPERLDSIRTADVAE